VPTEMKFYGGELTETNGKRITGDEVSKVHNFKLSDGGWDISYRPESIGSFFGLSDWISLNYKEAGKYKSNNGEPPSIKYFPRKDELTKYKAVMLDPEGNGSYVYIRNPMYREYILEFKKFTGSYKNINIELEIYSDGSTILYTDDGKLRISQQLVDSSSYESDERRFMLGVYEHNK
jgi:hypothetical protein